VPIIRQDAKLPTQLGADCLSTNDGLIPGGNVVGGVVGVVVDRGIKIVGIDAVEP
jgi:hypothetical protein